MDFNSEHDEIFYFKHIKCHLLALIQHYEYRQNLDLDEPEFEIEDRLHFYCAHLKNVKEKLKEFYPYCHYFKSGITDLDVNYFNQINQIRILRYGEFLIEVGQNRITRI